jgi:hypothetical protein
MTPTALNEQTKMMKNHLPAKTTTRLLTPPSGY